MIHQALQDDHQFGVISRTDAADARSDHMSGISREASDLAERSNRSFFVAGKHRLTRILDDFEVVLAGDRTDRIHITG